MAERTGCPILLSLWSYVEAECSIEIYSPEFNDHFPVNYQIVDLVIGCLLLADENWPAAWEKRFSDY